MKPTVLFLLAGVATVLAQVPDRSAIRDAATHEQLAMRLRQSMQSDPMNKLVPATGVDPAKAARPPDLVASSDVLCFGGRATLVPKRSILRIPPALADRLKFQTGAKLQTWSEFLAGNRAWVMIQEVSRSEAEGNHKIAAETTNWIAQSDKLVVATYMGGPISVLPPKEPAALDASASTQISKRP